MLLTPRRVYDTLAPLARGGYQTSTPCRRSAGHLIQPNAYSKWSTVLRHNATEVGAAAIKKHARN